MDREEEVRVGVRIDAVLDHIQSRVFLTGMAGKWHVGKATDLLQTPDVLEQLVELSGELEGASYLDQLPSLIADTKEQDRRCAECWEAIEGADRFRVERDKLIGLFRLFHFRPKLYERLVRQPDKPRLRDAIRLLDAGQESTPEALALERIVRMRLRDFVLLEEVLADDFRELDEAREALCAGHQDLALRIARSQPHCDESTIASAQVGLRRASAWYDYKHGYRFEEYALYWVQEAIDKRRG